MKSGKKKREALEVYLQNETIKWKGEPKPKFSITFLELGGHYDAMSGPTSIFGLVLGMTIVASMVFYNQSNWLAVILTILIGISILIIPEYLKNQRKKNTKYALTENKVFFQLWRWGKISIHSIDIKEIQKVFFQEENKLGFVYFIPKSKVDFCTYDFVAGEKRHYPTFEMIEDIDELKSLIEGL